MEDRTIESEQQLDKMTCTNMWSCFVFRNYQNWQDLLQCCVLFEVLQYQWHFKHCNMLLLALYVHIRNSATWRKHPHTHFHMGVSKNRWFSPQIIHFNWVFHYKPSILIGFSIIADLLEKELPIIQFRARTTNPEELQSAIYESHRVVRRKDPQRRCGLRWCGLKSPPPLQRWLHHNTLALHRVWSIITPITSLTIHFGGNPPIFGNTHIEVTMWCFTRFKMNPFSPTWICDSCLMLGKSTKNPLSNEQCSKPWLVV